MARLWSCGFELNTKTRNVEISDSQAGGFGTLVTTPVRSGTYAFSLSTTGNTNDYDFKASDTQDGFFFRLYFRFATLPGSTTTIIWVKNSANANKIGLRLTTGGALQLFNEEDAVQIGSNSSALSIDTWYRIELKVDTTTLASTAVDARIDGSSFASGTANLLTGVMRLAWGLSGSSIATYWDDFAINDDSGSFQNSWPGAGSIVHLRPNAAGDNAQWTFGTSALFSAIDEVTPNNVTDHIASSSSGEISDFNIDATPAAIGTTDAINAVQVGARFRLDVSDTGYSFVARVKGSSGGTVEEGSTLSPTTATWVSNAPAAPRNYSLTLYDMPGASTTAWTKADLDTAQIGVRCTAAGGTTDIQVSTLWLLVDYTPAAAPPAATSVSRLTLLGVG